MTKTLNETEATALIAALESEAVTASNGNSKVFQNGQSLLAQDGVIYHKHGDLIAGVVYRENPKFEAVFDLLNAEVDVTTKSKVLSKVDFMQLFTLPELTDIQDLQLGDPDASPAIAVDKNVRTVMRVFDETEQVDLTKPVVQGFVAYLKTKDSPNRASVKVLTAARATKILNGEPPASVI